jgi:hypothetical protein
VASGHREIATNTKTEGVSNSTHSRVLDRAICSIFVQKSSWISILLAASLIAGSALGVEPVKAEYVRKFTSYRQFLRALEHMDIPEFTERASNTSVRTLRNWQLKLPRNEINKLPEWNKRLALLPNLGFVQQPGLLTISPPTEVDLTVGLKPMEKSVPPLNTYEEFLSSIHDDPPELYRKKLFYTTEENFLLWGKRLAQEDPTLFEKAAAKYETFRQIGFGRKKFGPHKNLFTKKPIGFARKEQPNPLQNFDEFKNLLGAENLTELKARLYFTPPALIEEWEGLLKESDLSAFEQYEKGKFTHPVVRGFSPPCDVAQALNKLLP